MYARTTDPIFLFELPNTLVGDLCVTIIVQTIVTWLIEMLTVNHDLRKGSVQPIGFITEPGGPRRLLLLTRAARWFLQLDPSKQQQQRKRRYRKFLYVLAQVVRAFAVAVVCIAVLIGPSIGILLAVGEKSGGDWAYQSRWVPQAFKGILGAVLALVTTPCFVVMWMVKCGWSGGVHEAVMINGNESR